jgi:phosphatidylinositol glycan class F
VEVAAHGSALGGVVGAWVGALVIPLDWNATWQQWPKSVVIGSTCGFYLGGGIAVVFRKQTTG